MNVTGECCSSSITSRTIRRPPSQISFELRYRSKAHSSSRAIRPDVNQSRIIALAGREGRRNVWDWEYEEEAKHVIGSVRRMRDEEGWSVTVSRCVAALEFELPPSALVDGTVRVLNTFVDPCVK